MAKEQKSGCCRQVAFLVQRDAQLTLQRSTFQCSFGDYEAASLQAL